jgi:hypothetical protein
MTQPTDYQRDLLAQLSTVETYLHELRIQQAELEAARRRLGYQLRGFGEHQPRRSPHG